MGSSKSTPPPNPQAARPTLEIRVENPDGVEVHIQADIDLPEHGHLSQRFASPVGSDRPQIAEIVSPPNLTPITKTTPALRPYSTYPGVNINLRASIQTIWTVFAKNISRIEEHLSSYPASSSNILVTLAIIVYLLVRLIGLTDYPVHFTTEEATPTILASDFLRDGLHNSNGEFFSTFFPNGDKYRLGTTVYMQLVTLLIFGRSALAVRATSVLVGLIGAIGVSLSLRDVFRIRYWWAGILVLSLLPAWFHHSRLAYDAVTFASLYGGMLYFYLLYRNKADKYLFHAILIAALAFYAYPPGQLLIPITILFLIISDFRYHWEYRYTILLGSGLGFFVTLPYIFFLFSHSFGASEYFNNLQTFWGTNTPLQEKLSTLIGGYLSNLSPAYWFTPQLDATASDGLLHMMKAYPYLPIYIVPFLVWGLILAFRGFRSSPNRTVLTAFFIAPIAASLHLPPSNIPRVLVIIIPLALLTTIGLDDLIQRFQRIVSTRHMSIWALTLFIVLAGINFNILRDVLTNGTYWFDNIGSSGVQFGATKLFPMIQAQLKTAPNTPVYISPDWTINVDIITRFFMGDTANVRFQSIYDYASRKLPLEDNALFVLTADEYGFARENPKFSDIQIVQIIPYSPARTAFYLVHLKYSPESDQIIAAEKAERRKPITTQTTVDGQAVTITHPKAGDISVDNVFDNNPDTLFKTAEANPAVFDLVFDQPRDFKSFFIIHGSSPIEMIVSFYAENGEQLSSQSASFKENGIQGNRFSLSQPVTAKRAVISVKDLSQGESGFVHIWDIRLE